MILALVKPLSVAHCLRKPVKCTFLHTLTIHPSDVYLACVAGGICERASSGRAAIFPRGLCTRRNSWAAKPLVKFNSTQLDSTRLFTNLLRASPLAFTASLPREKHSREISTLYQSSHGFATKTKALAREIPPATQANIYFCFLSSTFKTFFTDRHIRQYYN